MGFKDSERLRDAGKDVEMRSEGKDRTAIVLMREEERRKRMFW